MQVDDSILDNLDAVLRDRDSDALARTAVLDDLHLSRGKSEKLEARLRQQADEEAVRSRQGRDSSCRMLFTIHVFTRIHRTLKI